jgi:hypothetical protein
MSNAAARVLELFLQTTKTGVTGVTHVTTGSVTPKKQAVTTATPVTCEKQQSPKVTATGEGLDGSPCDARVTIVEGDANAPRAWAEAVARLDPEKPPAGGRSH